MINTITLPSDGQPCEVTVLELFGLDEVALEEEPGPFLYKAQFISGEEEYFAYNPEDLQNPPSKPDKPKHECRPGMPEYEVWIDYDLHQAALTHYGRQDGMQLAYLEDCARLILKKCLSEGDRKRIIQEADLDAVISAALTPEVTEELLRAALKKKYRAAFEGEEILTAIKKLPESVGEVKIIRLWERELQMHLRMSREEYGRLPLQERAEMIVVMKLPDWLSSLEAEKFRREHLSKTR